jgi:succinylarginine dihydrolase
MLHEMAFIDSARLVDDLRAVLGEELFVVRATKRDLSQESAVEAYPFNSQVLTVPDGSMVIVAPEEAREDPAACAFLDRVVQSGGPVRAVHYIDLRQSMRNGGGPACLRLRIPLTDEEARAISANVVLDDALDQALSAWVERHYRDRLLPQDLADPELAREGMRALDELTGILRLGSIYDFQRG